MSQPDSGAATATKTRPAPPRVDRLPQFRVLLHNDDVHEVLDVIQAVIEITTLPKEQAIRITLEAHKRGLALVMVTHKERAELYRDQFQSKGLTSTIEPDA